MAKWGKRLLGVAIIGTAIAGIIHLSKGKKCNSEDEFTDNFEDEDFDLDDDLEPITNREYVPLTPNTTKETADSTPVAEVTQ
ncbi:MAG: hypothetical protein RSA90_06370 [Lachnospiraceae bacterium]